METPTTTAPVNRTRIPSLVNRAALRKLLLDIAAEEKGHLPSCYHLKRVADSVFDEAEAALRTFARNKVRSVRKGKTIQ
jgi:hypothetical protein